MRGAPREVARGRQRVGQRPHGCLSVFVRRPDAVVRAPRRRQIVDPERVREHVLQLKEREDSEEHALAVVAADEAVYELKVGDVPNESRCLRRRTGDLRKMFFCE